MIHTWRQFNENLIPSEYSISSSYFSKQYSKEIKMTNWMISNLRKRIKERYDWRDISVNKIESEINHLKNIKKEMFEYRENGYFLIEDVANFDRMNGYKQCEGILKYIDVNCKIERHVSKMIFFKPENAQELRNNQVIESPQTFFEHG